MKIDCLEVIEDEQSIILKACSRKTGHALINNPSYLTADEPTDMPNALKWVIIILIYLYLHSAVKNYFGLSKYKLEYYFLLLSTQGSIKDAQVKLLSHVYYKKIVEWTYLDEILILQKLPQIWVSSKLKTFSSFHLSYSNYYTINSIFYIIFLIL